MASREEGQPLSAPRASVGTRPDSPMTPATDCVPGKGFEVRDDRDALVDRFRRGALCVV